MQRLTLSILPGQGEALSALLEEAVASSTWFEDPETKEWVFQATFMPEQRSLVESLLETKTLLREPYFEELPEVDWLAENRKSFPPLEIGSFFIYSSYYDGERPRDKYSFLVEASLAFGTGQHQTTQACLIALEQLKEEGFLPKTTLDLGCGTALLAMAAYRLFGGDVSASDIDPEAIEVSETNLLGNELKGDISLFVAEGFEHPELQKNAPFDLTIANILAEPLLALAPQMYRYSSQEGRVILSGILAEQEAKIRTHYEATGFIFERQIRLDEWIALLFKRP